MELFIFFIVFTLLYAAFKSIECDCNDEHGRS